MDSRWLLNKHRDGKSVLDHATAVLETKPIHAVVNLDRSHSWTSYSPSTGVCECYQRLSYEKNRVSYLGLLAVAIVLVVFAALTSGLTLGVSSLNMTWLNIMSTTGSEKRRRQAQRVARVKRRASWFLCAMILTSVICMETLPIVVQSLFGTGWIPVVISAITIMIFAEVLPQYLIPRQALHWGYYCWPFIWACMWLTAIISWPLSWALDKVILSREEGEMYTNEQLGALVRLHERREKNGGTVSPDAGRVVRGALDLDSRTLEKSYLRSTVEVNGDTFDLEKTGYSRSDIIVPWSTVKRVNINDEVTEKFVMKIKEWSYSRIPVLGNNESPESEPTEMEHGWNGQRIFGFLHVKNLLGLDFRTAKTDGKKILVKDLPLYPLPIIRNDLPLYDLLSMFQIGMSRMAIVIQAQTKDWADNQDVIAVAKEALGERINWTSDFLGAAQTDTKEAKVLPINLGIRCPEPLGIVTFEDILDTLLQKTSRDEKDFFDPKAFDPPTTKTNEGDMNSATSTRAVFRARMAIPVDADKMHAGLHDLGKNPGTLRRRNFSRHSGGMDGPSDSRAFSMDGNDERNIAALKVALVSDHSSYTSNSDGGFHDPDSSTDTDLSTKVQRSLSLNPKLRRLKGRSNLSSKTISSPADNRTSHFSQLGLYPVSRHPGCDASPLIATMCSIPLVSGGGFSSLDEVPAGSEDIADAQKLSVGVEKSEQNEPAATSSSNNYGNNHVSGHVSDTAIGNASDESSVSKTKLNTLPRAFLKSQSLGRRIFTSQGIYRREESFHDDRALLPSQEKSTVVDTEGSPTRRTSFWV